MPWRSRNVTDWNIYLTYCNIRPNWHLGIEVMFQDSETGREGESRYNKHMESNPKDRSAWPVRKFTSFAEADASEREFYRSLTPEERLRILFTLHHQYWNPNPDGETSERLLRV